MNIILWLCHDNDEVNGVVKHPDIMIMVMMIPFWKRLIVIVSIEMTWGKIHAAFNLVSNQFYK